MKLRVTYFSGKIRNVDERNSSRHRLHEFDEFLRFVKTSNVYILEKETVLRKLSTGFK